MTDTPGWRCRQPPASAPVQFSSYDRAHHLENGKMIHPFANGDSGHYLRGRRGEPSRMGAGRGSGTGLRFADLERNPAGELRVYVDGARSPTLAAPFASITNGEIAPFGAPFGHDASRGRNLYFPFPFAKSIKITTTKGDQYFQVSVTTLPPETKVESYSPEGVLKRAEPVLAETQGAL